MTEKRPTIALVTDQFLGDYQTGLRDAVEMTAKEKDANFFCFIGRPLDAPNLYERIQNEIFKDISPIAVSGVIVMGSNLSMYAGKERLLELCRGFAPIPVCNIGVSLEGIPSVVIDNSRFAQTAIHLAQGHGCRNFAYIGGPPANEEAKIRRAAFLGALKGMNIPFDPALEVEGEFTFSSGCSAVEKLLSRGKPFDALVAANDTMAMGAVSILRKHGIHVPRDLKVTGFDDIPAVRFHSPSLSTMRQPLEEIGRYAVTTILKQIRGETVPPLWEVPTRLVQRQSCGCSHGKRASFQKARISISGENWVDLLRAKRPELEQLLLSSIQIPEDAFSRWAERLTDALTEEMEGANGHFVAVMDDILTNSEHRLWLIDELQNVISLLRDQFHDIQVDKKIDIESLWHEARLRLSDAAAFGQMENDTAADLTSALFLRRAGADLPAALTESALIDAICQELQTVGFENGWVSVYPPDNKNELECIAAIRNGKVVSHGRTRYDAKQLMPPFQKREERTSYVVIPLSSGGDRLGVIALELGAPDMYYEILREHMSSYLKSIAIFQTRVEQLQAEAEKQRQELEMQHRQKLESLGVLAGGIAHDFNNMLSAMAGNLDAALFDMEDRAYRPEPILECKSVVKHAAGLCKQLLDYSGKGSFLITRVNMNRILKDLEDLLTVTVSKRANLIFDLYEPLSDIEGDVSQINQIFVNLVLNAAEAMGPEGGEITIRTADRFLDADYFDENTLGIKPAPGNYVFTEVRDTGMGIHAENIRQIFDPFFTTKFTGRGLGLSAVLGIVRGHGGSIRVHGSPGEGTRFEMIFPQLPKIGTFPQKSSTQPRWIGRGTVLIVDDEPTVLRAGSRLLKRMGFTVYNAADGAQGIEIFRDLKDNLTAVILDITMPGIGGIETMRAMRSIRSEVPIVLTSGYSEEQAIDSVGKDAPQAFLQKPYDFQLLSSVLHQALGHPGDTEESSR